MHFQQLLKFYGLAGVRCGYAITSPEIASVLNKARSPFNVNAFAQVGALAALDDKEHIERSVSMVNAGRSCYVRLRYTYKQIQVEMGK